MFFKGANVQYYMYRIYIFELPVSIKNKIKIKNKYNKNYI